MREYLTVGLILVDGAQILAQHPHRRVEPLEGSEQVHEEQVPGVPETDVSPFMGEYGGIVGLIVVTVHHDKAHPTEWRHLGVTGHADDGAIGLGVLLATAYQQPDSDNRRQRVA